MGDISKKGDGSATSWLPIVGMACLWPCLQSSGFYPLSLVPGVERFNPALIAQCHFIYSVELVAAFAIAFLSSKRLDPSRLPKAISAPIAFLGAAGTAIIANLAELSAVSPLVNLALACMAIFVAYFVVFWGSYYSDGNPNQGVVHVAASYALSQCAIFAMLSLDVPQEWLIGICALGCGLSASFASSRDTKPKESLNPASLKQLPWSIVAFSLLLVYFCVIHIRLQIPQFTGDSSISSKCFAAILCFAAFSCVVAYLKKAPASPHRLTIIFTVLVGGYIVGLCCISIFSALDGGAISRRVLIADEHCIEAFLWMVLVQYASSNQIPKVKAFALYGIFVVALPWMISFDVRYLTAIGEAAASSNWVLPLVTVALCATALGALAFLLSYVLRISRNASAAMQQPINQSAEAVLSKASLTPRELEVATYVYRGYSAKRIAEKLYVSEPTVKSCTSHVYRKLGVKSKQELIDYVDQRRPLT